MIVIPKSGWWVDVETMVTEKCFSLNFEPSTMSKMKLVVDQVYLCQ